MQKHEEEADDRNYAMVPLHVANDSRGKWWRSSWPSFAQKRRKKGNRPYSVWLGCKWPVDGRGGWWPTGEGTEMVMAMRMGERREVWRFLSFLFLVFFLFFLTNIS